MKDDELLRLLDELEHRLVEKQNEILEQLIAHLNYHKENEGKWGLVKQMRDHPFRTLLIGFWIGVLLAQSLAPEIEHFLAKILKLAGL